MKADRMTLAVDVSQSLFIIPACSQYTSEWSNHDIGYRSYALSQQYGFFLAKAD